MAGRGRPPKPTVIKKLESNPGKRPLNKNEPKLEGDQRVSLREKTQNEAVGYVMKNNLPD